jgi:hypothetical protein
LLVPFKSTAYDLDSFDYITITREVRRSKNSTYTVFPVRLVDCTMKLKPINLGEPRDYEEARRMGETVPNSSSATS